MEDSIIDWDVDILMFLPTARISVFLSETSQRMTEEQVKVRYESTLNSIYTDNLVR